MLESRPRAFDQLKRYQIASAKYTERYFDIFPGFDGVLKAAACRFCAGRGRRG
jgi:hypothetical protein